MDNVKNINGSISIDVGFVVMCAVLCARIKSGIRIGAGSEHIQYRPFEFDFDFYVDIDVGVDVDVVVVVNG